MHLVREGEGLEQVTNQGWRKRRKWQREGKIPALHFVFSLEAVGGGTEETPRNEFLKKAEETQGAP